MTEEEKLGPELAKAPTTTVEGWAEFIELVGSSIPAQPQDPPTGEYFLG